MSGKSESPGGHRGSQVVEMSSGHTTVSSAAQSTAAGAGINQISPYDRVTAALEAQGCDQQQDGLWLCPGHAVGSQGHALKVDDSGDGTALITCFAGCATETVVKAVGLLMSDLSWPRGKAAEEPGPAPEWVARMTPYGAKDYPYMDEMGTILFAVHRGADKSFRQTAADGSPSLEGVRRVLFNLPNVRAAIARGETIHVAEGEKDAHAFSLMGLTGTCNPMGAGKWREEYAASLKGAKEVVVWQDKDDPGRKHAQTVCASLEAAEIPHRLVEARAGKDPWDHFAAGWSVDQAVAVVLPGSVPVNNQAEAAKWLRAELGRGKLSGLFRRDGALVHTPRLGEDGYIQPSERDRALGVRPGPAQVRPVDAAKVKALVEVRYNVVRKRGKEVSPALFPPQSAASAVNAAEMSEGTPHVRELHGITHTPIVRADGTVLDAPGYDDATGLLYLPDRGLAVPGVPDRPTDAQVKDAVDFILKPIAQFPFVSDDHRANWAGLMLTPLMRDMLPPPYQFGVIDATNPGSGKTLLASLIGVVHGWEMRGEFPTEAEEQRKAITAVLLSTTAPVVAFDNLKGVVRSSVLEALLTSVTYSDRLLGQNKNLSLTNDRLWIATGNNCKIGGDLARRSLFVSIDPKAADPHKRTGFAIPNLEGWMREHRGAYLAALLTVVRGWVQAGSPAEVTRSDSFARWAGALRGLLHWAGVPGTFGAEDDAEEHHGSEDDAEWGAFLAELHRVFGGRLFTSKDVLSNLQSGHPDTANGIDPASLPGDLTDKWERAGHSGKTAGVAKSLGKWLSNREGRYADGFVVRADREGSKRAVRYSVEAPDPTPGRGTSEGDCGLRYGAVSFPSQQPNSTEDKITPIKEEETAVNRKPHLAVVQMTPNAGSDPVPAVHDLPCLPGCLQPDPFDPEALPTHAVGCPRRTGVA